MALEDCPLCRGTGWKLVPRGDGSAGKMAMVCDCDVEDRAMRVMKRTRIPKRYEHCDFESFVTDLADGKTYTPHHVLSLKQAKLVAQKFADNYPSDVDAGLLFMGNSGAGKTHLAVATLKELVKRGHGGYFCEYGKLLKDIQASYNPESESTEMAVLDPVLRAEVLVIDSLGEIKPSTWVLDVIGYILNTRYAEGSRDLSQRRCTIITTNFPDTVGEKEARLPNGRLILNREECLADRIGARVRSRLFEMCRTVEIFSLDFRREVRQAGRARA
jgi:DNA replication protein DnaC